MLKKVISSHKFPYLLFHLPTVPYIAWLSLKARSLFFYGACNPIIHHNGGGSRASKTYMLRNVDRKWLPTTILVEPDRPIDQIETALAAKNLNYPLIAKPDSGERGKGVVKVHNRDELLAAVRGKVHNVLIQEYIDYPYEYGVLYWRKHGERQGHITSISHKDLFHVVGDGTRSVWELASAQKDKKPFLDKAKELNKDRLDYVPVKGERVVVDFVGHRGRGTEVVDAGHLHSAEMLQVFDNITRDINGFYYGRFDLKAISPDSLQTGEGLKILELNGTASVPMHIWDPRLSTYHTYRELYRHWRTIYEISRDNHKRGIPYISFSDAISYLRGWLKSDQQEHA